MGQCLHVHVSPPRICTLALWYLAAVGNGEVSNFVHNWLQDIVIKAKDFLSNHYPPFSWDGEQNVRAYMCEMQEFLWWWWFSFIYISISPYDWYAMHYNFHGKVTYSDS